MGIPADETRKLARCTACEGIVANYLSPIHRIPSGAFFKLIWVV